MGTRSSLANKQSLQPFCLPQDLPERAPINFLDQFNITSRLVRLLLNDVVHRIQVIASMVLRRGAANKETRIKSRPASARSYSLDLRMIDRHADRRYCAKWYFGQDSAMSGKIFINYRREDSIGTAGWSHDRLAKLSGEKIFSWTSTTFPLGSTS
jgi:hypothetical protein